MRTFDGRTRQRRIARLLLAAGLAAAGSAEAARITVQLDGVDGPLRDAALAGIELNQYAARDVTAAQAHRLYEHAAGEIRSALEPYGYYHAEVTGELRENGADYVAVLHVAPGEPVRIATLEIRLDGDADGQAPVQKAIAAFAPAKGQPLDHAAYEKSKAGVQAALFGSGYLEAELVTRRVEVSRSADTADIHLEWKVGPRFRLGETVFEGGQFPDEFLDRYVPWSEGDFYTQDKVLELQQRLIDADYFAVAQVEPDIEHAHDGIVPIKVMLAPAKRTIYTGGLFIGTDTGFGVRGGITRRWLNRRGHKGKVEAIVAERLKTINATYQIPLAGPNNHSVNFGFNYRDENTDTSQSNTWGLAATDSAVWNGWTRTYGIKFLTGDFEVANIPGNTTLLYPEVSLSRKRADDPVFVRKGYSLKFAARGVDPRGIEQALEDEAQRMERVRDTLLKARGRKPDGDEIEAGAEALRKGLNGAKVAAFARSAPSGRSLAVPLYVVGSLLDRGLPADSALRRVADRLNARVSDRDLEKMPNDVASPNAAKNGNKPAETGRELAETKRPGNATGAGSAHSGGGPPAGVPGNAGAKGRPATPPKKPAKPSSGKP